MIWVKVKALVPEIILDRCTELFNIVNSNPNALLLPCFSSSDPHPISFWSELASFSPNQTVLNKVDSDGFEMQFIEDSNFPNVNLDFFSMQIQQMPKKLNGQTMTNEELISHFRININTYSNVGIYGCSFEPILSDNALWASSNPLGAIVNIDIPGNDNGAVVCSDFQSCCWVFSTLKYPGLFGIGPHPVSGNRQFGIAENGGNKYFYIKGVDKSKNWLSYIFGYSGGDGLWNTTVDGFKDFITDEIQDGEATVNPPDLQRPNWNSIKSQLLSTSSINQINCE